MSRPSCPVRALIGGRGRRAHHGRVGRQTHDPEAPVLADWEPGTSKRSRHRSCTPQEEPLDDHEPGLQGSGGGTKDWNCAGERAPSPALSSATRDDDMPVSPGGANTLDEDLELDDLQYPRAYGSRGRSVPRAQSPVRSFSQSPNLSDVEIKADSDFVDADGVVHCALNPVDSADDLEPALPAPADHPLVRSAQGKQKELNSWRGIDDAPGPIVPLAEPPSDDYDAHLDGSDRIRGITDAWGVHSISASSETRA
ncbi:unnamed protein product [Peniophora sp. CBMAI 1063]|nr:unnamed protein product [Peniophora sp. CBMAI 1063]